jgi:hypothetical protein
MRGREVAKRADEKCCEERRRKIYGRRCMDNKKNVWRKR